MVAALTDRARIAVEVLGQRIALHALHKRQDMGAMIQLHRFVFIG